MDEDIEEKINEIGAEIEIIESISNALSDSLFGGSSLTQKDAFSFISLLEEKIKNLKVKQLAIVEILNI